VRWGHSPLIAMKGTKAVVVGTSRSQRADTRSSHPSAMMPRMDGAPVVLVIQNVGFVATSRLTFLLTYQRIRL
jgi:hypothetical protein